jgi:hypothetical protein
MELVVHSRFCSGRVRHWAVVYRVSGFVIFKSDHKASCLRVLSMLEGSNQ